MEKTVGGYGDVSRVYHYALTEFVQTLNPRHQILSKLKTLNKELKILCFGF